MSSLVSTFEEKLRLRLNLNNELAFSCIYASPIVRMGYVEAVVADRSLRNT